MCIAVLAGFLKINLINTILIVRQSLSYIQSASIIDINESLNVYYKIDEHRSFGHVDTLFIPYMQVTEHKKARLNNTFRYRAR